MIGAIRGWGVNKADKKCHALFKWPLSSFRSQFLKHFKRQNTGVPMSVLKKSVPTNTVAYSD
jgi:hypothetical protein